MTNLNSIKKIIAKEDLKVSVSDQSELLMNYLMVKWIKLINNKVMNHKELVDQVSSNIFKKSGKIESLNSWLAIRNYLEKLDDLKLKAMLKEK